MRNAATPFGRSAGEYHGSIVRAHGPAIVLGDCECVPCSRLDPWDPARRRDVWVTLDGHTVTLKHVRGTSFTMGTDGVHPEPPSDSWAGWSQAGPAVLCRVCDREAWPMRLRDSSPRCSGCGSQEVTESPN